MFRGLNYFSVKNFDNSGLDSYLKKMLAGLKTQ